MVTAPAPDAGRADAPGRHKSTICLEIAEAQGLARRTLDERDVREQALADPEGFLADLGDRGAFIDEVQRAPDLILAIKAVVDRDGRNGRYLLSGSNQPRIGKSVSDSLVGRATYRTLRPLTLSELRFDEEHRGWSFLFAPNEAAVLAELERRAASSGPLDWRSVVLTGGFPRAVAAPPGQRLRMLDDYAEIFSRRDILEILAVESAPRLEEFVRSTAEAHRASADQDQPVTQVAQGMRHHLNALDVGIICRHKRSSNSFRASVRSRALPARIASKRARPS